MINLINYKCFNYFKCKINNTQSQLLIIIKLLSPQVISFVNIYNQCTQLLDHKFLMPKLSILLVLNMKGNSMSEIYHLDSIQINLFLLLIKLYFL